MSRKRKDNREARTSGRRDSPTAKPLRIIGGRLGGRPLAYHGDQRTRPMKDRTREAVFNLLGTAVKDKHTIDLFAGTGALGLEAISRGAASATLIEQHIPTARVVEQNAAALGVEDQTEVYAGDMFFWVRNLPKSKCIPVDAPWLVFSSPPYDFYVERRGDMLSAIGTLVELSPPGSIFVVEADERFDMAQLPLADDWDVRHYAPAVVGILEKT